MAGRKKKTRKARPVRTGMTPSGGVVLSGSDLEAAPSAPDPSVSRSRPAAAGPGISAPRRAAVAAGGTAIDIDARVPYFARDLRQIGIIAGTLLVVIVVASFLLK